MITNFSLRLLIILLIYAVSFCIIKVPELILGTYLYGSTPSRDCETVGGEASANPRPSNAECTENILFAVSCIDSKSSSTSSAKNYNEFKISFNLRNYILSFYDYN